MAKIIFTTADGAVHPVSVPSGWSLMEGAVKNGVPGIRAECGGGGNCATCHVQIDPAWKAKLVPPNTLERMMLTLVPDLRPNSRLSCQIEVRNDLDGMAVTIPATQRDY